MTKKITHFLYWIFKAKPSGLLPTPKDPRDFNVGIFGWFDYQPKHTIHLIKTLSVKDQKNRNTCQFEATAVQKEVDEKEKLSVRSIVTYGKRNGMVSGNGFSKLSDGCKILKDWGIQPEGLISEYEKNWNIYSNASLNSVEANKRKIQSHWSANTKSEVLKLLDNNRILKTAIDWYTGFNQGGGFSYPWIISKPLGYKIGGHSFVKIGYILGYKGIDNNKKIVIGEVGTDVYVYQNSYGEDWGATVIDDSGNVHKGLFFIDMNYFHNNNWEIKTNLDIQSNVGEFLNKYDGKNVKGSKPTVYSVQQGKLKAYPDELTYLAYNVRDNMIQNYSLVEDEIIEACQKGDSMDIQYSLYWDYLKTVKGNQARLNTLINILSQPN